MVVKCWCSCSFSSSIKRREMIVLFLLTFVFIGMFEAVMDKLNFHFEKSIFKGLANQQFWDPTLSWRNKWKLGVKKNGEKFPLSSTVLVFTTDAWHFAKFLRNLCVVAAILLAWRFVTLTELLVWTTVGRILWGVSFEYCFKNIFEKQKI